MRSSNKNNLMSMMALLFVAIITGVPNPNLKVENQAPKEPTKIKPIQSEQFQIAEDHPPSKITPRSENLPNIEAKELIEIKSKNAKTYFQMKRMNSLSQEEIEKLSGLTPAEIKIQARKKIITRLAGYLESKKP